MEKIKFSNSIFSSEFINDMDIAVNYSQANRIKIIEAIKGVRILGLTGQLMSYVKNGSEKTINQKIGKFIAKAMLDKYAIVEEIQHHEHIRNFSRRMELLYGGSGAILTKGLVLLTGKEVGQFYSDTKETSKEKSCMTGPGRRSYLDLYESNDNIHLLVIDEKEGPQIRARALVWDLDCGKTFLDRIYPNDGIHIDVFKEYGKKRNWILRKHQMASSGDVVEDKYYDNMEVSIYGTKKFPYCDSFVIAIENFPKLTLYTEKVYKNIQKGIYKKSMMGRLLKLRSTSGGVSMSMVVGQCSLCKGINTLSQTDIYFPRPTTTRHLGIKQYVNFLNNKRESVNYSELLKLSLNVCYDCREAMYHCKSCGSTIIIKDNNNKNELCEACTEIEGDVLRQSKVYWSETTVSKGFEKDNLTTINVLER